MASADPIDGEAMLPFGMGEIDFLSVSGAMTVVALIIGFVVFHMTDSIGANLASWVNSKLGQVIGQNPATGQAETSGGAFD
jgi:hypothetical protein